MTDNNFRLILSIVVVAGVVLAYDVGPGPDVPPAAESYDIECKQDGVVVFQRLGVTSLPVAIDGVVTWDEELGRGTAIGSFCTIIPRAQ